MMTDKNYCSAILVAVNFLHSNDWFNRPIDRKVRLIEIMGGIYQFRFKAMQYGFTTYSMAKYVVLDIAGLGIRTFDYGDFLGSTLNIYENKEDYLNGKKVDTSSLFIEGKGVKEVFLDCFEMTNDEFNTSFYFEGAPSVVKTSPTTLSAYTWDGAKVVRGAVYFPNVIEYHMETGTYFFRFGESTRLKHSKSGLTIDFDVYDTDKYFSTEDACRKANAKNVDIVSFDEDEEEEVAGLAVAVGINFGGKTYKLTKEQINKILEILGEE